MAFHVARGEPLYPAITRAAREQFDRAIVDLQAVAGGSDKAVHQVRKRCKKLRGLLRLVRPGMDASLFRECDQSIRAAALALAEARDAAVRTVMMASLGSASESDDQEGAYPALPAADEARRALSHAASLFDRWPQPEDPAEVFTEGFRRTYRRSQRARRAADQQPSDENFHQLRKWVKYHWYQVRLLGKCGSKQLRKNRRILRDVGEILGKAHDLANLEASTSGSVRERAHRDKKRLLRKARGQLDRVLKHKPRRVARELRSELGRTETPES